MKRIRVFRIELNKAICSLPFLVCAGVTMILCLCAPAGNIGEKEISSFEIMFKLYKGSFSSQPVFLDAIYSGSASWLSMFIPILAAFPFIPVFCDERSGGNGRFVISREGKISYIISKYFAAIISGGFGVLLGYVLFLLIAFFGFSKGDEAWVVPAIKQMGGMFIYGGVMSLPALAIAGFVRNKYIIMCVPFMLKYIYDQVILMLISNASQEKTFDQLSSIASFSIPSIFSGVPMGRYTLFIIGGIALVSLALFWTSVMKRRDCGV